MQLLIDIALSLLYFVAFLILCAWTWRFWKMYINQKFLNKLNDDMVMLEIKLPREIHKSPLAAELAIASLLQGSGVNHWFAKHFKGNLGLYSSLEIASIEGVIHFYVRTKGQFRGLVESSFYAQYPGIEIVEAQDYTSLIQYHHRTDSVSMWGSSFALSKTWTPKNPDTGEAWKKDGEDYKMKADFLPLKTYVDYGLDKDPKEENKIDPITTLLEMMGSIGKGEHMWYQIVIQDESIYNDKKFPKFYVNEMTHEHMSLDDMAKKRKEQIRSSGYKIKGETIYGDDGEPKTKTVGKDADGKDIKVELTHKETKPISKKEMELTMEEKGELEAINSKFAAPIANVVIRLIYVTKKEKFNSGNIFKILSFGKNFEGWNKFAPNTSDPYEYEWENYKGHRTPWRTEEMFEAYVEREGFYPHIPERKHLDTFEDGAFWNSSMKARKTWRLLFEGIFHPFAHPFPKEVSALNLREVATLWHLPGEVATTPALPRIDSTKGEAPANLPQ